MLHFNAVGFKIEYDNINTNFTKSDIDIYYIDNDSLLYFKDKSESVYKLLDSEIIETKYQTSVFMNALDKNRRECIISITASMMDKYYYIVVLYSDIRIIYKVNFIREL